MQYNPYLWPNCQNFRVLQEFGVEEHDGDVRCKTESGHNLWLFRASAMKNMQYDRYYRNSSVIVDLVIGQISRSTERISSSFKRFAS